MAGYPNSPLNEWSGGSGGASLVDFFSGNRPVIHQASRNGYDQQGQLFGENNSRRNQVQRHLQSAEEDEDLLYVQEFRDIETRRIEEVNRKSKKVGTTPFNQKSRPCRNSMRSTTTERGPTENSIVGTTAHTGRLDMFDPTDEELFSRYDMQARRFDSSSLAIYAIKDKILSAVQLHQNVIIEGFTGCGKTTQVPQFILDDAVNEKQYCKIVVTQPRRIAATSVADRVSKERGWELGSLVGYQVGLGRHFSDDSRIVYMTTGVLLQTLINRKNLDEWTHIIIDEVHERDLDTDLLMLVLKTIMIEKEDTVTKIILMSATLNAEKFKSYFPKWRLGEHPMEAAIVKVPYAASFPVREFYLNTITGIDMPIPNSNEFYEEPKIANEIYDVAVRIIESFDDMEHSNGSERHEGRGAVLVFLPGLLEIETMFKSCVEYAQSKATSMDGSDPLKWQLLPLHSTISKEDQDKVFQPALKGNRKIILATNIAESSITVTDIKYVIDFCLTKSLSCDPNTNYTCLRMEWASKNQCVQRKGRCGRVAPGICYRMVPRSFFENFVQEAAPEMEKSSLESVVLHAKLLNMGKPKALLALAIDPPKLSGIRRAVANLKEVGALSINHINEQLRETYCSFDGELTYLGHIMAKLPIDLRLGRLIAMGHIFGVLEETIIIAAGLSTKSPFSYPYHRRLPAYLSKLHWSQNTFSDCFALVNVYRSWVKKFQGLGFRTTADEKHWAKFYLVQRNVMREIKKLVEEIKQRLTRMNIDVSENSDVELDDDRGILLKIAIGGAFYPNYFLRTRPKKTEYDREVQKDLVGRDPFTTVVYQGFPQDQPIELYSNHILKYFESGNDEITIPYLEQSGSKVLLSFDTRGHKIGRISHGVFVAVKMRQLRQNVSFRVMKSDQAATLLEDSMEQMNLQSQVMKAPEQTALPSITDKFIKVQLCYIESPDEFYVIKQEDLVDKLNLDAALAGIREYVKNVMWDECQKGSLVFIEESEVLYRARIELLRPSTHRDRPRELVLYLIDLGKIVTKKVTEVFILQADIGPSPIYDVKGLAIQCRLEGSRAPVDAGSTWLTETVNSMRTFINTFINTLDHPPWFKIFSIVQSVMAGDLLTSDRANSLKGFLLSKRLIEEVEESKDSQDNNNLRISPSVARQSQLVQDQMTAKQCTNKVPKPSIRPPQEEDSEVTVSLRGPGSPLEMSFSALCRSSHLKQVIVDGASVNSVALDMDYRDPSSRLLVAGSIGIAHRSGNLMARDTTLLPAIPNLTGLLTMIFCPRMELRVNDSLTEYTGALAGLGVDPFTGDPIYGDHDVEIMFDTVIDNDDISRINSIRLTMNYILSPNSIKNLANLRNKCQMELKQLLFRSREPMEEQWPNNIHQWQDLQENATRLSASWGSENQFSDVFLLHDGVKLH